MRKVAFITGIAGQDGAYLADFLIRKNYRVIGLSPKKDRQHTWRLDYFKIRSKVLVCKGSISDVSLIKKILVKYKPAEIYNLAGESSVARSWERPEDTWLVNSLAVVGLLENVRAHAPNARLFQASSVEMYGYSPQPITEATNCFSPLNPYAISKLSAHLLIRNYRDYYNLFLSSGVLFTHTSPLQADSTLVKNIIRGVARIYLGQADRLTIGDIGMQRDFSFAGDVVEAMWLILQEKRARDFVISSGSTIAVKEFVALAFECVGITRWRRYVRENLKLAGKRSLRKMSGSNQTLKKIGWKPKVGLDGLVRMMLDFELKNLKKYGDSKK